MSRDHMAGLAANATVAGARREHVAAIAPGLVVVFHRRRNGQLGERWTPRRPATLGAAEQARYLAAADEAQRTLQAVAR